jgi:trans-2,3-dihydro-3-hydroxyanthranilate isomerase
MKYFHVDVFSERPLSGNGLTVVFPDRELDRATLLAIAQEFKQFETSFVYPAEGDRYPTRIFTVQEELSFAGHPVLGVAAVLHSLYHQNEEAASLSVGLAAREVNLHSEHIRSEGTRGDGRGDSFMVSMDQGKAEYLCELDDSLREEICSWMGLGAGAARSILPMVVVSTGLPYLLLPVAEGLDRARVAVGDLESKLSAFGAKFLYLFDPKTLECRTWDNTGAFEDVATGSAAGPLIAYLVKNGLAKVGEEVRLSQGRWLGRPSVIRGEVSAEGRVCVRGAVSILAAGELSL